MYARTIIHAASVVTLLMVAGCGEQEVSFKKDVMPILQERCISCHKPGGSGYIQHSDPEGCVAAWREFLGMLIHQHSK